MSRRLFSASAVEDGVVSVCIATEDEPYMGPGWVDGFLAATATFAADTSVKVVVLEGGEPHFSAGASRDALLGAKGAGPDASYAPSAARALLDLPVPTIAAAAGHATGGGLMVGLLCDAIVLAEQSMYGVNFMALGFTPGMGATHVIPEAFGPTLGREMLFSGRLLTGREIRQASCPLSHAVIPRADVVKRARSMAREFAEASRDSLVLLKQNLAVARRQSLELALQAEMAAHARLFANPTTCAEIARRYPRMVSRGRIEES